MTIVTQLRRSQVSLFPALCLFFSLTLPVVGCGDDAGGGAGGGAADDAGAGGGTGDDAGTGGGSGEDASVGVLCGGFAGFECEEAETFCLYDVGDCFEPDAAGRCAPTPELCPGNIDPVCGCDGETYSNECGAHAAGVSVAYETECRLTHQGS